MNGRLPRHISNNELAAVGQGEVWGKRPLNCEMEVELATAVLQTPLLGVDEVLAMNPRP